MAAVSPLRSLTAPFRRAPRNADFARMHETFIVVAIATILVIRTQLWLTNYPQLGGGGLHIAHLLYGGFLMAAAIALLSTFLGHGARSAAVVIGGVGFGFFIDELGKFITADNDYFYKPAAALIYLIFVGLFLLARRMRQATRLTPQERLANALDIAVGAAHGRLPADGRARALALLDGCDPADPAVRDARALLETFASAPARGPSRVERFAAAARRRYLALVARRRFVVVLSVVFAAWALSSLLAVWGVVLSLFADGSAHPGFGGDGIGELRFVNVVSLASSTVSALIVAAGLWRLRAGDRAGALALLQRALLVAILVTRVCAFVESQFGAVFGLAADLLLYTTVRYMAGQEQPAPASGPGARENALAAA